MLCGTKIPKVANPEALLTNEIRKFDSEMKTILDLNTYHLEFDPVTGNCKTNFNEAGEVAVDDKDERVNVLKEELEQKKQELNEVEKEYLAKVAKLYILIQTHCEMKNEIYELFNKYNVGIEVKNVEKIVEINDDGLEFDNISNNNDKKEEKKKLLEA